MKKGSKNRFLLVLFGIVIGVFIGASVVWWNQNFKLSNWIVTQKVKHFFTDFFGSKNNESENNSINFEKYQDKKYNTHNNNRNLSDSIQGTDTLDLNKENYDDIYLADRINDSLSAADTSSSHNNNSSPQYIVKKDELLATKTLNFSGKQQTDNLLDSILLLKTGIKLNTNGLRVEFWKSPINFKGYKMDNHVLVIYGIYNVDFASFENEDKKLYMSYMGDYYPLETTGNFKPLIPSTAVQNNSKKKKP